MVSPPIAATDISSEQKPRQRIRASVGPNNVRIHDFRHSFASMAVSGGDSL